MTRRKEVLILTASRRPSMPVRRRFPASVFVALPCHGTHGDRLADWHRALVERHVIAQITLFLDSEGTVLRIESL